MKNKTRILSICGSLRPNSSNNSVVEAIAALVPENIDFIIYRGLADLPAFNDSRDEPPAVTDLRKQLSESDGVFICTPEYAFGVPGALKNMLDWTVASGELVGKPVAVVTASTGGEHAHASLLLTLKALSAKVPAEGTALISFVRTKLDDKGNVKDPKTLEVLKSVLDRLVASIDSNKKSVIGIEELKSVQ